MLTSLQGKHSACYTERDNNQNRKNDIVGVTLSKTYFPSSYRSKISSLSSYINNSL